METQNSKETFTKNSKVAEKWLEEMNVAVTEIYEKQIKQASGFYDKFFNSMFGVNSDTETNSNLTDFLSLDTDKDKEMLTLFNGLNSTISDHFLFLAFFDKLYKQTLEHNRNLFNLFTKEAGSGKVHWDDISEKYQKSIENQFETLKNIQSAYVELNNKQADLAAAANKKMLEEMNKQFDHSTEQVKQLWADILKSYKDISKKKENETPNQKSKKRTGAVA